ncbi:maestro heat-like repeat-containing protein family member 1, partial [Pseudonaja textilis]|uniref:maestro heat-like repeat-containing protein family member 1 n=1 Tax=Pseudonaja textilis TaxID=8673 RepID=UPI000EA99EFA
MSRLLIVASQPFLGGPRGAGALRLLLVLRLSIHPAAEPLWTSSLPALLQHLEATTEASLSLKDWQDQLLQFLQKTLDAIVDAPWTAQLVSEMCRQLSGYNGLSPEKNFLYKAIGVSLAACANKDLVRKQLQELLETARYQEEAERE